MYKDVCDIIDGFQQLKKFNTVEEELVPFCSISVVHYTNKYKIIIREEDETFSVKKLFKQRVLPEKEVSSRDEHQGYSTVGFRDNATALVTFSRKFSTFRFQIQQGDPRLPSYP